MSTRIEVCAADVESALAAAGGGADRIELCSALEVGGVTPGPGTIQAVRKAIELPLVILVRPRRGDFLYTGAEFEALLADIDFARAAGAEGVALGVLDSEGGLDRERTARLVERARPLEVTFHRAFDLCRDRAAVLEELVELGVDRILTSGGAPDVVKGIPELRSLVELAGERIGILPGGGVRAANALEVKRGTGASELHLSASRLIESSMRFPEATPDLGAALPGEHELRRTSADDVRAVRAAVSG